MTSLLIAIALAIVWIFLSGLVAEFAENRGHSGGLWYLFSLAFTPLIGFFIVSMLPSAADLIPAGHRRCSLCAGILKADAAQCPYCHADLSGRAKTEKLAA
ncbi:MAG TPA: hypothetical protein VKT29_12980 [Terriglobales bacterium]|nr:hypothetical protein [Terriglobales bacterium]